MKPDLFVTDDAAVGTLVRTVLSSAQASDGGKATYLRSLAAGTQVELGAKPVLAAPRGRKKAPDTNASLDALERVHKRFYAVVIGAVNELPGLDAVERNSRSGFARSAMSTLRRAIRYGLNPLTIVIPDLTKTGLREWANKHSPPPAPVTAAQGIERVRTIVRDLVSLVEHVEKKDQAAVISQFYAELDEVDGALTLPQPATRRAAVAPAAQRGH